MGLVDADVLLESIRESAKKAEEWLADCKAYKSNMTARAEQAILTFNECGLRIKSAPTVDAVPVEDVFELAIALSKGIEVLELPARVYNALSRSAYYTVADVYVLWKSGNLKKLWNLGDKSIRAVEDRLCEYLRRWRTEEREGER